MTSYSNFTVFPFGAIEASFKRTLRASTLSPLKCGTPQMPVPSGKDNVIAELSFPISACSSLKMTLPQTSC